jgi:GH15 family glucan-1,4-alpha-glucosidase
VDIYTAARRVAESFQVDGRPLDIGKYGVVGDGSSCALVGVDGSVDWLCFPSFDSPSVLAAILDRERGGFFRVSPQAERYESLQAYDDSTNVLQTLFRRPGEGVACVTDFMPWSADPRSSMHELHRLLEAREGSMEMEVVFDPRFDYARGETRIDLADEGVMASGPNGERLSVSIGGGARFEKRAEGGAVARFSLRKEQRLWTILSWRSRRVESTATYRPYDHLRSTRRFWRQWSAQMTYDGPWRHDVLRSALTLKILQYAPTGAVVAAPTTSLPVVSGGHRNWDYRYSWTRDSAMAIRAMNLIGYSQEALGFFEFVRDTVEEHDHLDLMVTVHGGQVPDEVTLENLAGHAGSRPVRLGNAARHQTQHDIVGPLLDAASLYEKSGGTLGLAFWRQIRALVSGAMKTTDEPDNGIWEKRGQLKHHVHSKLMTWVALDRALHLSPLFGGDRAEPEWRQARDRLQADILDRGYNSTVGTFVGEFGGTEVEATSLLIPIYGFLPPTDARVERTVKRVIRELSDGKFLRRYRSYDGIDADEGAFVLCGFWLAEALALAGRLEDALEVFTNHLGAANHLGLLAEEVDPSSGAPLGNYPQAFSHIGLIQAAARLDLALRMRDEGIERPPLLDFDFPDVR